MDTIGCFGVCLIIFGVLNIVHHFRVQKTGEDVSIGRRDFSLGVHAIKGKRVKQSQDWLYFGICWLSLGLILIICGVFGK